MKNTKLGFKTKEKYSYKKWFNKIELPRGFRFLKEFNLVINLRKEQKKLYNAIPCVYTDKRFEESLDNSYGDFYWDRQMFHNLSSCIRQINKAYDIPKGTIVEFDNDFTHANTNDTYYKYKTKRYKPSPYIYNIDLDGYNKLFTNDEHSNQLIVRLRQEGFIVEVFDRQVWTEYNVVYEEYAIVYGYNKKIGFSCFNNNFNGYSNGYDNILFDEYDWFDKWSRCIEIPKSTPLEEIINILKTPYKYN